MELAALKRKNANLASEVRRLNRELERAEWRRSPEPGPLHFERALLRRLDGQQIAEIAGLTIRIQEPEIPGDPIAASASSSRLVFTTSEMATWQDMSFNGLPECTLEALDRYDDSVLLTLTGAVLSGRSTSFQTNQRIGGHFKICAPYYAKEKRYVVRACRPWASVPSLPHGCSLHCICSLCSRPR